MTPKAFLNYYEDHSSHCYGCGRLNAEGFHIKSFWDGDGTTVCRFTPKSYHIAMQGYVHGGLIASVIDCHSTGTAAVAVYPAAGRSMGTRPELRYLTASLHVDYLKPTPIGVTLVLRGQILEIKDRKVVITVELRANEKMCARGRVVALRVPENWKPE